MILCTQATTKVFKSDGDEQVLQTFALDIGAGATLAFVPDPVTCFERAKYQQKQVFRLTKDSNLVFVDWVTSGRKRNYIATGRLDGQRTEVHEHWDFQEYDTAAEIYVDGEPLLIDRVRLSGSQNLVHCLPCLSVELTLMCWCTQMKKTSRCASACMACMCWD